MMIPGNFKPILVLYLIVVFLPMLAFTQKIIPMYDPMPIPPSNKNMLFYLQRTMDKNTVIYEVNYDENGKINIKDPIKIYWIDYEEGGKISQLTNVQRKFAYGIKSKLVDKRRGIFKIIIVSYKNLDLYLMPGEDNRYIIRTKINGQESVLNNILVYITGGTYLKPDVKYVEITGNEISDKKLIKERFQP